MGANTSSLSAMHTRSKEKAKLKGEEEKKAQETQSAKQQTKTTKKNTAESSASTIPVTAPATVPVEKPPASKTNALAPKTKVPEQTAIEILPTPETTPPPSNADAVEQLLPEQQSLPSYATSSATKYLQKQLKSILKEQLSTKVGEDRYWTLDLARLDDLYTWHFSLSTFDPSLPLANDMQTYNITTIDLEVKFGPQHPKTPPFVRVVRPRFLQFMHGGGGHVTAGGSICVDMLTMKGWKAGYGLEQILMVVHQALSSRDPAPARLIGTGSYSVYEAVHAYIRVANTHGWQVPHNWRTLFTR
jgi:ubiquitin-protein ligase